MATTLGRAIALNPTAEGQEITNLGAPLADSSAARLSDVNGARVESWTWNLNGPVASNPGVDGFRHAHKSGTIAKRQKAPSTT